MTKRLSEKISKNQVKSKCLIGPKLYNKYLLVIKIVLAFIFVGMCAELILKCKSNPVETGNFVGAFCSQLITIFIQAFGWITFIFIILERFIGKNENI